MLPTFLSRSRWFPERSARAISTEVAAVVPMSSEPQYRPWLVLFEANMHGETQRYAMPVRILWERLDRQHFNPKALAAVRQGAAGRHADRCRDPAGLHLAS